MIKIILEIKLLIKLIKFQKNLKMHIRKKQLNKKIYNGHNKY